MKYSYKNVTDPGTEEGLAVVGRDGTGVLYQLSHGSYLSYQILPDNEIVFIEGMIADVTNLPRGVLIK